MDHKQLWFISYLIQKQSDSLNKTEVMYIESEFPLRQMSIKFGQYSDADIIHMCILWIVISHTLLEKS